MGASAILKSVDFKAFAVNVKTIAPIQRLYQFGHAIWITDLPMPVYSFLEEYDFGAKTIIPFVTHGGSDFGSTRNVISELQPGAFVSDNGLSVARDDLADGEDEIRQWAESLNLNREDLPPESSSDTVAAMQYIYNGLVGLWKG